MSRHLLMAVLAGVLLAAVLAAVLDRGPARAARGRPVSTSPPAVVTVTPPAIAAAPRLCGCAAGSPCQCVDCCCDAAVVAPIRTAPPSR